MVPVSELSHVNKFVLPCPIAEEVAGNVGLAEPSAEQNVSFFSFKIKKAQCAQIPDNNTHGSYILTFSIKW